VRLLACSAHLMDMNIIGKTIVDLRPLTAEESADYGWAPSQGGVVIVLDDGTTLIPSRDSEGNGPAVLFGTDDEGDFLVGTI
jgi:hypothetical protein